MATKYPSSSFDPHLSPEPLADGNKELEGFQNAAESAQLVLIFL